MLCFHQTTTDVFDQVKVCKSFMMHTFQDMIVENCGSYLMFPRLIHFNIIEN